MGEPNAAAGVAGAKGDACVWASTVCCDRMSGDGLLLKANGDGKRPSSDGWCAEPYGPQLDTELLPVLRLVFVVGVEAMGDEEAIGVEVMLGPAEALR